MASYTLVIELPQKSPEQKTFDRPRVTLGRRDADLVVSDGTVSTKHGELRFEGGKLSFADVGSSNGSFRADGSRISKDGRVDLEVGGRFRVGNIWIEVAQIERPAPKRAPAPAPPAASGGGDKTAMLTSDQLQELLAAGVGPGPAAVRPKEDEPAPPRRALPEEDEPAPLRSALPDKDEPAPPRRATPEPPARGASRGLVRQPQSETPRKAPPRHPDFEDEPQAAEPEADWVAAAKAPPDLRAKTAEEPKAKGKAAEAPPREARPRPARAGAVAPDELEALDQGGFGGAFVPLFLGAIHATLALFKEWGSRAGSLDDVKAAFGAAWGELKPVIKEAPLPILAVNGAAAVFGILSVILTGLAGLLSLLSSLVSILGIFATAATYVYFLRRRIGQPVGAIEAFLLTFKKPVPFILSMLIAAAIGLPGVLCVVIPGMFLLLFAMPLYFAEGRRSWAINRRSLWLVQQDAKRILLCLLGVAVLNAVVSVVFGIVLGILGTVGIIVGLVVGAVLGALVGAFTAALVTELYFDVRARFDHGDAEDDARANLLDEG